MAVTSLAEQLQKHLVHDVLGLVRIPQKRTGVCQQSTAVHLYSRCTSFRSRVPPLTPSSATPSDEDTREARICLGSGILVPEEP